MQMYIMQSYVHEYNNVIVPIVCIHTCCLYESLVYGPLLVFGGIYLLLAHTALSVPQGSYLWSSYRDFEEARLATLQVILHCQNIIYECLIAWGESERAGDVSIARVFVTSLVMFTLSLAPPFSSSSILPLV